MGLAEDICKKQRKAWRSLYSADRLEEWDELERQRQRRHADEQPKKKAP